MVIPGDVTRRVLLRDMALGTVALASGVKNIFGQSVARPPNIVFIMADDLGYADVSCYGRPDISTPNIDNLAAKGVRFLQAYANSAVCSANAHGLDHRSLPVPAGNRFGGTSGWPRCRPSSGPSHPAVVATEGRLQHDPCRKVASGRTSEIWPSPKRVRPFLRIPRWRCRLLQARKSKRRFVGRRRAGAPNGLSDGYAWRPRG